jgi:hypothetical protein
VVDENDLVAEVRDVELARARVAEDVAELKQQLSPENLKDRALDAAERSVESIAARALKRLREVPRALLAAGRAHPGKAAVAATLLVAFGVWRVRAVRSR